MIYAPSLIDIDELLDAGISPAQALALLTVSRIALSTVARNCNLLRELGATAEEIEAYQRDTGDELASWVMRSTVAATPVAQELIEARAAARR